jgi:hypothetical protein
VLIIVTVLVTVLEAVLVTVASVHRAGQFLVRCCQFCFRPQRSQCFLFLKKCAKWCTLWSTVITGVCIMCSTRRYLCRVHSVHPIEQRVRSEQCPQRAVYPPGQRGGKGHHEGSEAHQSTRQAGYRICSEVDGKSNQRCRSVNLCL